MNTLNHLEIFEYQLAGRSETNLKSFVKLTFADTFDNPSSKLLLI